eukprot:IDg1043t1
MAYAQQHIADESHLVSLLDLKKAYDMVPRDRLLALLRQRLPPDSRINDPDVASTLPGSHQRASLNGRGHLTSRCAAGRFLERSQVHLSWTPGLDLHLAGGPLHHEKEAVYLVVSLTSDGTADTQLLARIKAEKVLRDKLAGLSTLPATCISSRSHGPDATGMLIPPVRPQPAVPGPIQSRHCRRRGGHAVYDVHALCTLIRTLAKFKARVQDDPSPVRLRDFAVLTAASQVGKRDGEDVDADIATVRESNNGVRILQQVTADIVSRRKTSGLLNGIARRKRQPPINSQLTLPPPLRDRHLSRGAKHVTVLWYLASLPMRDPAIKALNTRLYETLMPETWQTWPTPQNVGGPAALLEQVASMHYRLDPDLFGHVRSDTLRQRLHDRVEIRGPFAPWMHRRPLRTPPYSHSFLPSPQRLQIIHAVYSPPKGMLRLKSVTAVIQARTGSLRRTPTQKCCFATLGSRQSTVVSRQSTVNKSITRQST